jgi:hypothetical protein
MLQGRQAGTDIGKVLGVKVRHDHPFTLVHAREYLTPRVYDHAVAVR